MKKKFKSILLIDDNVADNRFNQIILEEMDVADNIQIAESGEDALNILSGSDASSPDLILLDINMPKMNGWEFLEAYKKLNLQPDKKETIIVLSTSKNPEDRKKAEAISSVAEFDIKPLTPAMLKKILEKYSPEEDEK